MSAYVKVVLVTGGSSGLGAAICSRLAAMGHVVYGTSRKPGDDPTIEGYKMLRMDVRDEQSVVQAVEEVLRHSGRIDVLVNNAGIGIQGPCEDISVELAGELLDTNLMGPHRMCRAVLPHMRRQKAGLIINISSLAANFGLPYRGFYSASKAALERYGEALAMEMHPFGVHVVSLQPGDLKTPIANSWLWPDAVTPDHKTAFERSLAIVRRDLDKARGTDDVARMVARIVADPTPKPRYVVAHGLPRLSVLLGKFLPARLFQRLLRKHYE